MNQLKQTGPAREGAACRGHVSRFMGHGAQVVNLLQERARFCRGDLQCPKAVGNFWPGPSGCILVDVEGGLRASWDGAKFLYKTGQPQAALSRICDEASLPIPEPITPGQLAAAGVEGRVTMKLPLITSPSPHDQTASYRSVLLLPDLSLRSHAKVRSRSGHPGAFHQRLPLGSHRHSVQC